LANTLLSVGSFGSPVRHWLFTLHMHAMWMCAQEDGYSKYKHTVPNSNGSL